MWVTVFSALGGSVVGTLGGTGLLHLWLNHRLTIDREKLNRRFEEEAAETQRRFEHETHLLQIKYGGIYQKQAEFLIELYPMLVELGRLAQDCDSVTESGREEAETALSQARTNAFSLFSSRRLLLPPELDGEIEELLAAIDNGVILHRQGNRRLSGGTGSADEAMKKLEQGDQWLEESIKKVQGDLRGHLQKLLGVDLG